MAYVDDKNAGDDKYTFEDDKYATDECVDSTSWYYKKQDNNCAEKVAEDPDKYCKSKYVDDFGITSAEACVATCGDCGSGSDCEDSTSWYTKKSKNTCENYVSEDPDKYCKSKYIDWAGISSSSACPFICGKC